MVEAAGYAILQQEFAAIESPLPAMNRPRFQTFVPVVRAADVNRAVVVDYL
jgi:hypothetical protein